MNVYYTIQLVFNQMNYKLLYRVFTYKVSSEEALLNVPLSILKITFALRSLERFRKKD